MADAEAAPVVPAKKTQKKKATKPKKPSSHPKYSEMIKAAIASLKERGGSSRQAILKYIMKHYSVGKDERVVNNHLKMALRAGVKNNSLKQSKGQGASGSFRLGEKKPAKKPKAKKSPKAKKAAAKKPAGEKKAKKPKAKKAKSPSPKKASKPKKAAKKAKSPKKAKAAKPKAKKSPKKKAAKKAAKK